jgi:hypothetical protein
VVATALVATTVWGCGGGDGDDVVAEPAAGTAVRSDVEEAYLAYWAMVGRLESELPGQDAEIAERATGPALTELTSEMAMLELSGQLNVHNDDYDHQVLSVEVDESGTDTAVLRDCFVNDATLIDRESREPVPEVAQGPVTELLEVTLVMRDTWQIQQIETLEKFDGATPESCAVSSTGG